MTNRVGNKCLAVAIMSFVFSVVEVIYNVKLIYVLQHSSSELKVSQKKEVNGKQATNHLLLY